MVRTSRSSPLGGEAQLEPRSEETGENFSGKFFEKVVTSGIYHISPGSGSHFIIVTIRGVTVPENGTPGSSPPYPLVRISIWPNSIQTNARQSRDDEIQREYDSTTTLSRQ